MLSVTPNVRFVGVEDDNLDLFEGQYPLQKGISYNSYVIDDEKIAVVDSVDRRRCREWLAKLEAALNGRTPDYLIVQHMEPDHSACIAEAMERYPALRLVATERALRMLPLYFESFDFEGRTQAVGEGDTLSLGAHTLQFHMAPMVHWPEVMVTYDRADRLLFSADAFGKFGVLSHDEDWACEARRYYFNICGKYGNQVQALLKKASKLDIAKICPLHGPVLEENLGYYVGLYDTWSRYEAETEGVLVAYASIHGGTAEAAEMLAGMLDAKGAGKIAVADLSRCDMAEAIEDAFRMNRMVLAAASYDGGLFPPMLDFLHHLQSKGFRNRRVALIENGSWAPSAGREMAALLDTMKDIERVTPVVTIRGRMKQSDLGALEALADALLA